MSHAGGLRAGSSSFFVLVGFVLVAFVLMAGAIGCTDHDADGSIDAAGDYHDPLDPGGGGGGGGAATGTARTVTTTTLPASVPSPACFVTGNALYVVDDSANLNAGDGAVLARLRELGLTVTVKSDDAVVAGDATGKQLIVISSSVGSSVVGPIFRNTAVPIVTWEYALYDDLGLTGNGSNDNGALGGQSKISMIDSTHALTVGLTGLLRIMTGSGNVRWGKAAGGARALATVVGDTTKDPLLYLERGAALVGGGTAPARRVGFFFDHATAQDGTPAAWLLFDASVVWALGNGTVAARAWLVTGASDITDADAALRDRLQSVGFTVSVVRQDALAGTRLTGVSLVVVAESVDSATVSTFFNDLAVPVVVTEDNMTDIMGMASSHGRASSQTNVTISNAASPLAAGLSGDVRVYNSSSDVMWAEPGAAATVVARSKGSPTHPAIFGYETGATMVGRTAPARRLSLFHYRGNNLTTQGGALFNAGVTWAGASRAQDFCPGEASSCERFELGAARTYNPSSYIDDVRELAAPFSFWIPPTVPVTQGNSGNHHVTFSFGDSATSTLVRCSYVGSGTEATPSTPDGIARADRYDFDTQVDGNCGGLVPGNVVSASYFRLRVEDGGNSNVTNGRTEVTLVLAGPTAPNDATCNAVDEDCDGRIDDDYPSAPTTCGVGACAATGSRTCIGGAVVNTCAPGTPAASDTTCNNVDDNCNGSRDEGYVPVPTSCGVGACVASGTTSCVGGAVQSSCTPGTPAANDATCNNVDDNCNGSRDEGYVPLPTSCGVGACAASGATSCVAGAVRNSCTPGPAGPSDTTCNAVDENCNGSVDEGYVPAATSCGVGACVAIGSTSCVAGAVRNSCTPGAPGPSDTTCNGIDENCNGSRDEGYVSTPTTCGIGACAATGTTACVAGAVQNACTPGTPGPSDTTCNNIDENCNGAVDEGYVSTPTTCGIGACRAQGATSCVAGGVRNSCTPGVPAATDATCNNIDENCNGAVDEGYASTPTTCGIGACAATGATSCVGGAVQNSCTPGPAGPSDTTCNGIDENCSGRADEGYVPVTTTCGIGACVAVGVTTCVAGGVHNSCTPGTPALRDDTCNGIDDDCDGQVDEDFAPAPTSCGVGACSATGRTRCVAGVPGDTCRPGTPAANDASCNNLDDNCNGQVDEGYASTPTSCGVGACAATGGSRCVAGQVVSTCQAGTPAASDASCNNLDDNCNGQVDEGYVATVTTCGTGSCAATGAATCVGGAIVDTCHAGSPGASDASCDGRDDNCNGVADEGYVPTPTSCGVGACSAGGHTACIAGHVEDTCRPGEPAGAPATIFAQTVPAQPAFADSGVELGVKLRAGVAGYVRSVRFYRGVANPEGYVVSLWDASGHLLASRSVGGFDQPVPGWQVVALPAPVAIAANTTYVASYYTSAGGYAADHFGLAAAVTSGDLTALADGSDGGNGVYAYGTASSFPAATFLASNYFVDVEFSRGLGTSSDASCNGIDDDCDGATDEDYAPTPTSCGVGTCVAAGVTRCVGGTVSDTCVPTPPSTPVDVLCNGRDDDCDGQVDEDFPPAFVTCGVGACTAIGRVTCSGGTVHNDCTPNPPAPNDTTCNGIDDNCSGSSDEGYVSLPTTCGIGACRATGATTCVAGGVVDSCHPGTPAASDTTCNNIDENCSGAADEGYVSTATTCGVGSCRATGATTCVAGSVLDSCHPGTPGPSDTTCNNVDENCSGVADEGYVSTPTSCGIGACRATGATTCVNGGVRDSCQAGTPAPSDTTCNGIDENCSGANDEGYVSHATTCGVGACSNTGMTTCAGGAVRDSCAPRTPPSTTDTVCNGIDDNCNGRTDEGYVPAATTCGVGACRATGVTSCVSGGVADSCRPGTPAVTTDTSCNGIDDDCDGQIDEDYAPHGTTCGVGACGATGVTSCVAGRVVDSCAPGTPPSLTDTTCNGIDENCNGRTDEGYQPVTTSCGVGACVATSVTTCVAGIAVDSCRAGTPPSTTDATCNGIDDDCSGQIDEDYAPAPTTCGIGACTATGRLRCVGGVETSDCHPSAPAANDALCNGIDDDCDGQVDEDFVAAPTSCGVGACHATGATTCTAGHTGDSCHAGTGAPSDTLCNGIDDDCDGSVDEDYPPLPTTCGVGACTATGRMRCVLGAESNDCRPNAPALDDSVCNGIDDDCDGPVDEDFHPATTSCGVGACRASGATRCTNGGVVDSCHAGTPAASDTSCNGVDDNCNGQVDEGYVAVATSCGIGACHATGATSCTPGGVVDSCRPGPAATSDATCDGIDDNCNGTADEQYAPSPTTCGVGACTATGRLTCSFGVPTNDCRPSPPAANDTLCNNVDDDCDGHIDEDYVSLPTSCGVGTCHATGATACVAGSVADSCRAGTPAADDRGCDGLDNDCNGVVDDGYQATPTTCGRGACVRNGQRVCTNGGVVDTCAPGAPAPADRTCDTIDDDCDGSSDEDYIPVATSCGVGACVSTGTTACAAGHVNDSCRPGTPAASEICDGIDNDCDGATDEADGTLRWSRVNRPGPSPRWGAAIASDDAHGRLLLHGGRTASGLSAETWGWNGLAWSLLATSGPPRRIDQAMAYDSDRDRVVLFGGLVDNFADGETWEWNGAAAGGNGSWTRVATTGPSPRYAHAMAYDAAHHVTVLFGGVDAAGTLLGDTWLWDGAAHTWSLVATAGPTARKGQTMGYDPVARTVSLVGGHDGVVKGDRWEWDGSPTMMRWTATTTSLLGPREEHTMVYDEARARFVVFGGIGAFSALLGDTRQLIGGMWAFILSSGPSARFLHAMGFDTVNDATLVFGGADLAGNTFGDTWLLGEQCFPQ